MPTYIGSAVGGANAVTKEYPVANGVTVSDGDFVYLSGGRVTNASIAAATQLLGIVQGGQSNDPSNLGASLQATGNAAGTVTVLVTVEPQAKYVLTQDNIGTTFAASHVGQYFSLIGSTGAQLADTSTVAATPTAAHQLMCIGFGYNGDNTKGVFVIAEHAYKQSV